jgi:hypothetical protein
MSRGALTGVGKTRAKKRSGNRAYVLSKGKGIDIGNFGFCLVEYARSHSPQARRFRFPCSTRAFNKSARRRPASSPAFIAHRFKGYLRVAGISPRPASFAEYIGYLVASPQSKSSRASDEGAAAL